MLRFALLVALTVAGSSLTQGYFQPHSRSSSQYIHGNDTIQVTLSDNPRNTLHGQAGSSAFLEFNLLNEGMAGYFDISQASEDGFEGVLSTRREYLKFHQEMKVKVDNLRVPNRPDDSTVRFTLTVRRDDSNNRKRREAPPSNNPNNNYPGPGGGNGNYPGNNNPNYPGGNYPGNNNPNYPGNNYPNNNYPGNNYPNYNDPSFRTELQVTVIFTVTDELKDNSKPWVKLTYGAKEDSQACQYGPGDPLCESEAWWVKFSVQDEESGINEIRFLPDGKSTSDTEIYYRYENFPIGSRKEHDIVAASSCCLEGIKLMLTDVKGNQIERVASNTGTGTPMSKGLKWGLIIGGIVLILIIVGVIVGCCCKKRYSSVSSNP